VGTDPLRPVPERSNLNEFKYITEEWEKQGVRIEEEGDHILKLMKGNQVIAVFSQTGVQVENVLKVAKEALAGKYD